MILQPPLQILVREPARTPARGPEGISLRPERPGSPTGRRRAAQTRDSVGSNPTLDTWSIRLVRSMAPSCYLGSGKTDARSNRACSAQVNGGCSRQVVAAAWKACETGSAGLSFKYSVLRVGIPPRDYVE
jgi:hypothetical protein